MTNDPIERLLRDHERDFQQTMDRLAGLISHFPSIGQHREELLRAFLKDHLPKNCAVGTGFVYSDECDCRQCDILLYDHTKYQRLFRSGDIVVVEPDSVVAVIEVKTELNSSSLKQAYSSIADLKNLCPKASGYVFGYRSCGGKAVGNSIETALESLDGRLLPDGIYGIPKVVMRKYEANLNGYHVDGDGRSCFGHFYADLLAGLPTELGVSSTISRIKLSPKQLAFTLPY